MANLNTLAKQELARKKFDKAMMALVSRTAETPTLLDLYEAIKALEPRLDSSVVETSNLDPIFTLTQKVEPEIQKAETLAKRAKSEAAALKKFSVAGPQLLRYADQMENGLALVERMKVISELDLAKVADLQPIFVLCDEVFASVGDFQNEEIVRKVNRPFNGWLTAKDKTGLGERTPGKYAEAFVLTEVHAKVLAWKANMPVAGSDFRVFKTWRDAGYTLRDELETPWGKCTKCNTNKLLPWKNKAGEWVPNSSCHDCYVPASKSGPSGKKFSASQDWEPSQVQSVGMDMTGWTKEDIKAFQEDTERKREEARRTQKAAQKAKKQASRQQHQEESHEEIELEAIPLSAKDQAENDKIMKQAMARSASFKVPAPAKKVTEAKRDGKKKKSQETEAAPKKGKKK